MVLGRVMMTGQEAQDDRIEESTQEILVSGSGPKYWRERSRQFLRNDLSVAINLDLGCGAVTGQ